MYDVNMSVFNKSKIRLWEGDQVICSAECVKWQQLKC